MNKYISLLLYLFAFSANAVPLEVKQVEALTVGSSALPAGAATETSQLLLTKPSDNQNITFGDTASIDAAGKARVTNPFAMFDHRFSYGIDNNWEVVSSGGSSTAVFLPNESSVLQTIGTGATDFVYLQTHYFRYIPGKSEVLGVTAVIGSPVANVVKRIGLFDDQNGLFFEQSGSGMGAVVRSFTSGSVVDTRYDQADWNLDTMDGSSDAGNPSGILLDPTQTQLLMIDFLWQGVGRIRYGLNIGGTLHYVHEVNNANEIDTVFMSTPDLPVRYEVRNTAASAGATLKQICTSLISEGGYTQTGIELSADTGITTQTVTTEAPVMAIRMALTFNGITNRKIAQLLHVSYRASGNDALCRVYHFHDVTGTAGGAWVAADADSAVEYNLGITSVTAVKQHQVNSDFIGTGVGGSTSPIEVPLDFVNNHSFMDLNAAATVSEIFAVYCTSFSGNAVMSAEMTWVE